MAKLSLKHIYKIYDNGTKAVNDFNLEIGDDEFIVFVGPSGCGKSTTLRMIAGLEDITAGDFYIDGELANQLEPKDRDMAMVFQNYALYPHMTVYDNMAFGLKIRHVPKNEIEERVQEAARILDIADQLTKKPKAMSGGQRQRVALGRAIVRKPKVFLLDEPLSNLDAKLRSSMRSEITRLHKVLGTTFIYVTHDQVEAMTMGTRIVVMSKGVMQQVDTPMNLYDYPANLFVAGFIGTPQMNFLNGVLKYRDAENIEVHINDSVIVIPVDHLKHFDLLNVYKQTPVKLGVRPEHISLCNKGEDNAIKMTIGLIEALGNDSNLLLESADGTKLTIKTLRNDAMRIGDEVYIKFDLAKTHIFDAASTVTLLPRKPISYTISGSTKNGKLSIFDKKVDIPSALMDQINNQKSLFINLPASAIIEGNTFSLPIVEKIQVNKEWVNILKCGNEYLAKITSEYVYGDTLEFDLDYSSIDVYDKDMNRILSKLDKVNCIVGKLQPVKREMHFVKKTMKTMEEIDQLNEIANRDGLKPVKVATKTKRLFNYDILNQQKEPSDNAIIKIYSLLGKKFDLHDVRYELNADNLRLVSEGGYAAVINKVLDFGNSVYYVAELKDSGATLLINSHGLACEEGSEINIDFDSDAVGVFDLDFEVKLI